jgi:mRNA interferase RelE/StbE
MFAHREQWGMKTVTFLRSARKALFALPPPVQAAITAKLDAYAADPRSVAGSVSKLVGFPHLRMRVGDYRVIFDDKTLQVLVIEIDHRKDIYR